MYRQISTLNNELNGGVFDSDFAEAKEAEVHEDHCVARDDSSTRRTERRPTKKHSLFISADTSESVSTLLYA